MVPGVVLAPLTGHRKYDPRGGRPKTTCKGSPDGTLRWHPLHVTTKVFGFSGIWNMPRIIGK